MDEMQMKKKEVVTVNAWLANEIKVGDYGR
jgi:hypothetical protein